MMKLSLVSLMILLVRNTLIEYPESVKLATHWSANTCPEECTALKPRALTLDDIEACSRGIDQGEEIIDCEVEVRYRLPANVTTILLEPETVKLLISPPPYYLGSITSYLLNVDYATSTITYAPECCSALVVYDHRPFPNTFQVPLSWNVSTVLEQDQVYILNAVPTPLECEDMEDVTCAKDLHVGRLVINVTAQVRFTKSRFWFTPGSYTTSRVVLNTAGLVVILGSLVLGILDTHPHTHAHVISDAHK
eukprot:Blabericola_migrator_1__8144@NODE_41_length_17267_cov_152_291279_g37_i0_p6_GENE_NODE_41_length_17267_cov_152_291279_g37_i0NODE_41_length_17267_cov_152_291279_g37_i0_p6_ORF_typecomplete_len250_score38_88_NODE_41_length_17267_cov_152_291279_g37_i015502299